jgi:two-component sensor histidine kinase
LLNMAAREGGTATQLAERMTGSLQALSSAQGLVTPRLAEQPSGERVTMKRLLQSILAPYSHGTFKISGPDVEVGPQSMNVLALVIHELATNAVKYGALSSPTGVVTIGWKSGDARIVLNWVESNGPALTASPVSHGFGTVLATKSIRALRGTITPTWLPAGLSVEIELPSDVLAQ